MQFLHGPQILKEIEKLGSGERLDCAVAFWGQGSERLLESAEKVRVILNLKSGGTNPSVVEALLKTHGPERIRQYDKIHAKVYLGADAAIVTSANASINGLKYEGDEAQGWEEAGTLVSGSVVESVKNWFDGIWNSEECTSISPADLENARVQWTKRSRPDVKLITGNSGKRTKVNSSENVRNYQWWLLEIGPRNMAIADKLMDMARGEDSDVGYHYPSENRYFSVQKIKEGVRRKNWMAFRYEADTARRYEGKLLILELVVDLSRKEKEKLRVNGLISKDRRKVNNAHRIAISEQAFEQNKELLEKFVKRAFS